MTSSPKAVSTGKVAQAIVDFALHGGFPDEDVSSLKLTSDELTKAVNALAAAKSKLEFDIHAINEETAGDVQAWRANATSVQDDIVRSKAMANEIQKQADTPQVSGQAIHDIEAKADLLVRELSYNQQVQHALKAIRGVNQTLDQVEQACDQRHILDALHMLENSWTQLDAIPASKSCRVIKLLDIRAYELKSNVHGVLDHVWKALVQVDVANGSISIAKAREDEPMSLADAVIGLQAYKEVDERMTKLWHDLDQAIIGSRMDITNDSPRTVLVKDDTLQATGAADKTVKSLFTDLEQIFLFLQQKLPPDLVKSMSTVMMPEIMTRLTTVWLDSAVPSSLQMDDFQQVIEQAKEFCGSLEAMGVSGFGGLLDWVDSAPKIWLNKCREAALDAVRSRMAGGLGASKQVEKVEKQVVSKEEGQQLTANGAVADTDDHGWDAAWDDDDEQAPEDTTSVQERAQAPTGEDDGTDAWGWGEDEAASEDKPEEQDVETKEDDPAEAWGWGGDNQDEETKSAPKREPITKPKSAAPTNQAQRKELLLKETYSISSMPEPVLALIFAIVEDGAALTQSTYENSPVAAAAAGLFSLPTLALAMFRAISPHFYALDIGGSMYLYNDACYLGEKLAEFAGTWKDREGLSKRAQNMLRLDNDVKVLQSFANRAYSKEMNTQKVVLRDLLGAGQNLMQQDETESCVDAAVARIRSMAITWEEILARSVWCQAVGSLIDTLSNKIISDVMEMPSIGQDEAYDIAKLIATVTELDDLFLPSKSPGPGAADEIPSTAQYASSWLRLKYLSEVLQSNLRDVRYLWMESELSLYFTADEVTDLINISFEDNARTREVLGEITRNPHPRATGS